MRIAEKPCTSLGVSATAIVPSAEIDTIGSALCSGIQTPNIPDIARRVLPSATIATSRWVEISAFAATVRCVQVPINPENAWSVVPSRTNKMLSLTWVDGLTTVAARPLTVTS